MKNNTEAKTKYYTRWTPEEKALLKSPMPAADLARKLNRSVSSIESFRSHLGFKLNEPAISPAPVAATTVQDDLSEKDDSYWAREFGSLNRKYHTLLKAETTVERLVTRVLEAAPKSYSALPPVVCGAHRDHGQAQSALLMLSDTHIGKQTPRAQTLNFGDYGFPMFMARLKYLEESIISINENHVTTKVPELVIAMLGDMLDGTLAHSNEVGQVDPIFNQFYCGAHAVAQFLRNLAPHFPKIRIYDVVGNHTRMPNQKRMPTKNRYSNFDKFFYALVRELVRDIKTIDWTLDAQPYQIFDVQGFTFFTAHGDSMRGGDKTLGVPNHAVGRLVSTATQLMNKYGRKAPNYYLMGHLHRDIILPHATGNVLFNGGFPGVDEFGLSEMFAPSDPSQKLFYMHPTYGKTATYDISLKFANPDKATYTIPDNFPMS